MRTAFFLTLTFFAGLMLNYLKEQKVLNSTGYLNLKTDTILISNQVYEHEIADLSILNKLKLVKKPNPVNTYKFINDKGKVAFQYMPSAEFSGYDTAVIFTEISDKLLFNKLKRHEQLVFHVGVNPQMASRAASH